MRAVVYRGRKRVRVEERPRPVLQDDRDAIVRVTSAGICGSDLHLYHYALPGLGGRIVIGHEAVGFVEAVGEAVESVAPGDRVVVSGLVADGTCWYCRRGLFSQCEGTNANPVFPLLHGQRHGGLLGYGPLMGGYDGGQAEALRVPFADVGLLKLPEEVTDDQAVFLSDVLCTGWQACERGDVGPGTSVAVWGCGPVGLMALAAARARGAKRLFAVDRVDERLRVARERLGAETIHFEEERPARALIEATRGRGPDVCIEAAGFRYPKSLHHKAQYALKLETDAIDAVSEMVRAVRKGGAVVLAGFFVGYANQFPMGALMEKGVTIRGSPVDVQRHWRGLLERLHRGELDPAFAVSHRMPLAEAPEAYRMFDEKRAGVLKVVLEP